MFCESTKLYALIHLSAYFDDKCEKNIPIHSQKNEMQFNKFYNV